LSDRKIRATIEQQISVKYTIRVRNPDGSYALELPRKRNLVMDAGLNKYASTSFVGLFTYAIAGTGTNPVNRYSAPVTVTQLGNTVTASAAFFATTDVGYILKYGASGSGGGGAEQYITGYTSSTVVTVSSSATVAAGVACCIWYVTQTQLQTKVKATNTYAGTGNGTVLTVGTGTSTYAHTRIFIFSAEAGSVTYNEIGWSWDGTNIFGRDLITPSGVALIAGQQLEATLEVSLTVSPTAQTAVADVSGGTWNTAGNALIEYAYNTSTTGPAFSYLNSAGGSVIPGYCEPSGMSELCLPTSTWTQLANLDNAINPYSGAAFVTAMTQATYTAGSFTTTWSVTIPVGSANGTTFYGVCIGQAFTDNWTFSLKLTTPNSKTSSYTLSFTFTSTWTRLLLN
jgi:hypothetical protein